MSDHPKDAADSGERPRVNKVFDKNTLVPIGLVVSVLGVVIGGVVWLTKVSTSQDTQINANIELKGQLSQVQTQLSELKGFMQAQAIKDEIQSKDIAGLLKRLDDGEKQRNDHETRLRILERLGTQKGP